MVVGMAPLFKKLLGFLIFAFKLLIVFSVALVLCAIPPFCLLTIPPLFRPGFFSFILEEEGEVNTSAQFGYLARKVSQFAFIYCLADSMAMAYLKP